MKSPDPPPPRGTRTPALVAGIVIALLILVVMIWYIATYPEARPETRGGEVPASPTSDR